MIIVRIIFFLQEMLVAYRYQIVIFEFFLIFRSLFCIQIEEEE